MTPTQSTPTQAGIIVSTAITAGIDIGFGEREQHAEGIVVSTAITAGASDGCTSGNCSDPNNHAEGVVVSTAITAGIDVGFGERQQHAEGIVVTAPLTAGGSQLNRVEGIILLTA